jgi:glycosyltransferase involved in cell wall biosynthesis
MKVLLDHSFPFALAHGGLEMQILRTHEALLAEGVEVDWLRWWDGAQKADLIHFFGRPSPGYINLAHQKGVQVVFTALHSGLGARPPWKRQLQKLLMRTGQALLPELTVDLNWNSYHTADACIVLTPWEAHLARDIFRAPPGRVHVVPNGIEPVFVQDPSVQRSDWLLTTASILPVKRVVETAEAAVLAGVRYRVAGKPFAENDPYYRKFVELCRAHPDTLIYDGPISDRARLVRLYQEARGFVLLSAWEAFSLSALEAAACGCPLMLSDMPWAHSVFGTQVTYGPVASPAATAPHLRAFHQAAPRLRPPPRPLTWREVGAQLKALYQTLAC